jgi:hypothetical protein
LIPAESTFFASSAASLPPSKIGPVQRHGVAVGTLNAGQHRRILGHLA